MGFREEDEGLLERRWRYDLEEIPAVNVGRAVDKTSCRAAVQVV